MGRRACDRFVIPGATVACRKESLLFFRKKDLGGGPILDISRGGLCFLTNFYIPFATKIVLQVSAIPDDDPLILKGRVSWVSHGLNRSYKYTVGVEFNAYGSSKKFNSMDSLKKLIELEKRFSDNKIDLVAIKKG